MIGTDTQFIAVLMAQDCRNIDTVVRHSTVWIDIVHLAQVGSNLACLLIYLGEIIWVCQVVLTDFELNPPLYMTPYYQNHSPMDGNPTA